MRKHARTTADERAALAETLKPRYAAGESIRALADSTGRSYGFVHDVLVEAGVKLRGRGGSTKKTPANPAQ